MSSRQIRKLREAEEARKRELLAAQEEEEEESEEEVYQRPAKPSGFSAFAALQDDDNDDEDDEEDDEAKKPVVKAEPSDIEEGLPIAPAKKAKKSKKKKTKKASKAQKQAQAAEAEDEDDGTDIDAALEALNLKDETAKARRGDEEEQKKLDPEYEEVCRLLCINSNNLKVANEMRNLFGRVATDNREDVDAPAQRGGRRRRMQQMDLETALKGRHAPGKGFPEVTLRRNMLIAGKDEWPRAPTGGLSMEIVEDSIIAYDEDTVEFRYLHDIAYERVQQQFRMFVEMGDPQNLIGLLVQNPYNVSLLLQVSKVAKDQSDHSLSNDLVERALFTFGRAATSQFGNKMKEGKARLNFNRPENRELWLAGYQYIKSLIMKGTYRSAFEWAKFLLMLDPYGDPYRMDLMLHHLALRAHESQWIIDLSKSQLYHHQTPSKTFTNPSVALAHMNLKQPVEARALLRKSIRALPYLAMKLYQELNIGDVPKSIWGQEPMNEAEELMTRLYIKQTKDLWNTPEAITLFTEVCYSTDADEDSRFLVDAETVDLRMARFVYLDNTPELMAMIPSDILHREPNSDSDPLPPSGVDNIFSWPGQEALFQTRHADNGDVIGDSDGGHINPLELMRRWIPGFRGDRSAHDMQLLEDQGIRADIEADLRGRGVSDEDGMLNEEETARVRGFTDALYRYFWGPQNGMAQDRRAPEERDEVEEELEMRSPSRRMPGQWDDFDDEIHD